MNNLKMKNLQGVNYLTKDQEKKWSELKFDFKVDFKVAGNGLKLDTLILGLESLIQNKDADPQYLEKAKELQKQFLDQRMAVINIWIL